MGLDMNGPLRKAAHSMWKEPRGCSRDAVDYTAKSRLGTSLSGTKRACPAYGSVPSNNKMWGEKIDLLRCSQYTDVRLNVFQINGYIEMSHPKNWDINKTAI